MRYLRLHLFLNDYYYGRAGIGGVFLRVPFLQNNGAFFTSINTILGFKTGLMMAYHRAHDLAPGLRNLSFFQITNSYTPDLVELAKELRWKYFIEQGPGVMPAEYFYEQAWRQYRDGLIYDYHTSTYSDDENAV